MKSFFFSLHFFALRIALWLTIVHACGVAAMAQDSSARKAVALSNYLVLPSKNSKLVEIAGELDFNLEIVSAETVTREELQQAIAECDLLVIDAPHPSVAQNVAANFGGLIEASGKSYVLVGELGAVTKSENFAEAPLRSEKGVTSLFATRLREYWRFGGGQNSRNAIRAMKGDFAEDELPLAITLPPQGFYHPHWPRVLTTPGDVWERLQPKSKSESHLIVAIAVNHAVFTSDDTDWLNQLIDELESQGLKAYAFFGPRQNANLFFEMTRMPDGETSMASLMINAALVFKPNERKAELERIAIPVLQTLPSLAMDESQWQASAEGLSLVDISYYYTSSELAGMIDPLLITARDSGSGSLRPITQQISALAEKAASMIQLQQTPRAQRQTAIMVYNYPQGEGNFGASFLNVPASVENILRAMRDAGYQTEQVKADLITQQVKRTLTAFYHPESMSELLRDDLAAMLSLDEYLSWFRALPNETQKRIETYWGPAESSLLEGSSFIIPRLQIGRVVVMPQPLRHLVSASVEASEKKNRIQHRSPVPLSHQYLATYLWLKRVWKADALIHLGTHGTAEWSPGKERGLSVTDDPYLALGSLPNIYPYIMDNLGEAITAKRRGRAVIISHLTPMFTPAGFRPGLHEMHELMHDWETVAPGPVRKELELRLIGLFVEHQLHRDLQWNEAEIAADFERFLEELHPYLDDIAQAAQPQGLAAFGAVPSTERRFGMVMQMLRKPMIDALGEDIDEVFLLDFEKVLLSRPARWLRVAISDPVAASKLDLRKQDSESTVRDSIPNRAESKILDPVVLLALAMRAQQLDKELSTNEELDSLLHALDGKHVSSSYGGDPVRNPESLPTGRNLYGFDPSRVPTRQAWEIGVEAFNQWMHQFKVSHDDKLPAKIAYSLWAGETMRHQGVMESQVLWAMGVKPIWDDAGRVTGLETISASELGRPRIDVLLSVTGSYRDQFPLVMQWIDQAVRQVVSLDETDNQLAKNTDAIESALRSQGMGEAESAKLAAVRIFSNEAGGYGNGLSDAVLATDVWTNDSPTEAGKDMSQLFIDRMGYAFGDNVNGVSASAAFAQHLSQVDTAIMSRTSHTYGVLTSDDPFQYLGGLSLAIRNLRGVAPRLYVQNLRDESEVITDDASVAIAKEVNSRYLHPQWIKSQQAEGYSGTLQVLKSVQFLWGWQVTAPQTVREDQWQSFHEIYVRDRYNLGTEKWLRESNEKAFAQILERMLDAIRLDYWQPDSQTREELVNAYLESATSSELIDRNMVVSKFAESQQRLVKADADLPSNEMTIEPIVPGNEATATSPPDAGAANDEAPLTPTERVSGLKLEVVEDASLSPLRTPSSWAWGLGIALLCFGAWRKARRLHA